MRVLLSVSKNFKFQFIALLEVDTVGEGLDPPLRGKLHDKLQFITFGQAKEDTCVSSFSMYPSLT